MYIRTPENRVGYSQRNSKRKLSLFSAPTQTSPVMSQENDVVDVDAGPWIAPTRAPVPTRRAKTKATASLAEQVPELGSSDSSGDEDFAPTTAPSDDNDSDAGEVPLESEDEDGDDTEASAKMEKKAEDMEEWEIYKPCDESEYIGPPKPEPTIPVKPAVLARIRARIRAKKQTQKEIRKFMQEEARHREVVRQAKEELRAEAENGNPNDKFWTRGKHDVNLEDVRAKVNFALDTDDAKNDVWEIMSGKKRKRNAKTASKSKKARLSRMMESGATNTN